MFGLVLARPSQNKLIWFGDVQVAFCCGVETKYCKCGNLMSSFSRGRHGIVTKSVQHVQHAYLFLMLKQSINCLVCGLVVAIPVVNAKAPNRSPPPQGL